MQKLLFLDRDGTLIREPNDYQVDAHEKVHLLPGVIHALKRIQDAGWGLVIVTNQDGLGTPAWPREKFEAVNNWILALLAGEGISFLGVFADEHFPEDNHPNRKPGTGMVDPLLAEIGRENIDWAHTWMIGDRSTDAQFAQNLGCRSLTIRDPHSADGEARVVLKSATPPPTTHVTSWAEAAEIILGA